MAGQIHQLTQQSCNVCGQGGVQPREESYYDRYTQETVTEAVWVCYRCGNRFAGGEISRVKHNESKED
jgi:ribosomal protein L37AE/L43A